MAQAAQPFHVGGAAAGPLLGPEMHQLFGKASSIFSMTMSTPGVQNVITLYTLTQMFGPKIFDVVSTVRHWIRVFFTSSVTIRSTDELYLQVFNWLAARRSDSLFVKEYMAQTMSDSRSLGSMGESYDRFGAPRNPKNKVVPKDSSMIKYTPASPTPWFFHAGNLFAVLQNDKHSHAAPQTTVMQGQPFFGPALREDVRYTVTITCLGWSTAPIEKMLEACRELAEQNRRTSVTIHVGRSGISWTLSAVKPVRSLDTIHLDPGVKESLLGDLAKYLDPRRRQFYGDQGIPYRRGYLLHGPPGCGKTSLSLGLAGKFGLDLYMVDVSTLYAGELELLFAELPSRCIVLLEDIDAVGFRRAEDTDDEDDDKQRKAAARGRRGNSKCSLSSLLNVLDGVSSQEGRVVIMTSNFPDNLDEALIRPGRVDVKVHLGYITQQGAEGIFVRMMKTALVAGAMGTFSTENYRVREMEEGDGDGEVEDVDVDEELETLARDFARRIPEKMFAPAEIQGYLLQYLHSARLAVEEMPRWVEGEMRKREEKERRRERKRLAAAARVAAGAATTTAGSKTFSAGTTVVGSGGGCLSRSDKNSEGGGNGDGIKMDVPGTTTGQGDVGEVNAGEEEKGGGEMMDEDGLPAILELKSKAKAIEAQGLSLPFSPEDIERMMLFERDS